MTKQTLLTAAATAALAFCAFGAQANDLTLSVGGVSVSDAPLRIASEAPFSTTANRTAEVIATVDYDTATFPAGNNLVITYTLADGAVFGAPVLETDLIGFDEVLISSGGSTGSSEVVFLVDGANAEVMMGDTTGLRITTDIRLPAGTSAPSVNINTETEAGTPIEGGDAVVDGDNTDAVLITRATGFTVAVTGGMGPENEAKIAADYAAFDDLGTDTRAQLGTVQVSYVATAYSGFTDLAATLVSTTDPFNSAALTIDGTFTNLEIVDQGADTSVLGQVLTIAQTGLGDAIPVELDLDGPASASDYDGSVVLDLDAGWLENSPAGAGDFADITREGTSYMVAWVSSGTLAATNSTNNIIRISNESDMPATVLVEVTASATVGGLAPVFTPGIVDAGIVPPGGERVLTSASLQTLLGGDFRRADVRVIVEAEDDVINVLRQVVQPNGQSTELSVTPETTPVNDVEPDPAA